MERHSYININNFAVEGNHLLPCYLSSSLEYPAQTPCKCILCTQGKPACLRVQDPSWTTIVWVILFVLHHHNPERLYFPLKSFVYPYVVAHWSDLVLHNKNTQRWKKQILDALSHGTRLFATGQYTFFKNGYWGLKCKIDPWSVKEDGKLLEEVKSPQSPHSPESPTQTNVTPKWKESKPNSNRNRSSPYKQAYHHAAHVHHQTVLHNLFPRHEEPLQVNTEVTENRLPPFRELLRAITLDEFAQQQQPTRPQQQLPPLSHLSKPSPLSYSF